MAKTFDKMFVFGESYLSIKIAKLLLRRISYSTNRKVMVEKTMIMKFVC